MCFSLIERFFEHLEVAFHDGKEGVVLTHRRLHGIEGKNGHVLGFCGIDYRLGDFLVGAVYRDQLV